MIFENFTRATLGFLMCNQLIKYYVYSNYSNFNNLELMRIATLKFTLIFPMVALVYELIIFVKNYKSKKFIHRKLKNKIIKIQDLEQKKYIIIVNGLFIMGIMVFYFLYKPKVNRQYSFYLVILNLIILELYFIFNSLNNIQIRNGIFDKGILFMGNSYKWNKIDNIKINKEKKEIYIVRVIPILGEITRKIKYSDKEVLKYLE